MNKNYTTKTLLNKYDIDNEIEIEVIEYLIAENRVLQTIENLDNLNSKSWVLREEIVNVLNSDFDYESNKSNAIIDQMIADYLIEPSGAYLSINQFIKHADNLWIINPDTG